MPIDYSKWDKLDDSDIEEAVGPKTIDPEDLKGTMRALGFKTNSGGHNPLEEEDIEFEFYPLSNPIN